jgi:hypothetical protein
MKTFRQWIENTYGGDYDRNPTPNWEERATAEGDVVTIDQRELRGRRGAVVKVLPGNRYLIRLEDGREVELPSHAFSVDHDNDNRKLPREEDPTGQSDPEPQQLGGYGTKFWYPRPKG